MLSKCTIDRLITGISSIVSENRCSLTNEEVNLLKDCIRFLETVKVVDDLKSQKTLEIVSSVMQIFLRVILSCDFNKLKDFLL